MTAFESHPSVPTGPRRVLDFTKIADPSAKPAAASLSRRSNLERSRRIYATIVVTLVVGTTTLALYDLFLFLAVLLR